MIRADIQYVLSDGDVFLLLEALASHRKLAESEMLSVFERREDAEKCRETVKKVTELSERIKKHFFDAARDA